MKYKSYIALALSLVFLALTISYTYLKFTQYNDIVHIETNMTVITDSFMENEPLPNIIQNNKAKQGIEDLFVLMEMRNNPTSDSFSFMFNFKEKSREFLGNYADVNFDNDRHFTVNGHHFINIIQPKKMQVKFSAFALDTNFQLKLQSLEGKTVFQIDNPNITLQDTIDIQPGIYLLSIEYATENTLEYELNIRFK